MLRVTFHVPDSEMDEVVVDCDYVSFVTSGTFGPPALIAPSKDGGKRAGTNESVCYVNPALVPVMHIERVSD